MHTIHTDTNVKIHIHTHTYAGQSESGGVFVRQWRLHATPLHSATYPDHLDGARGVLAEREMHAECLLAEQGVHLGSPNACCARRCAKTGQGVGLRWPEKVVGHLPRGALSGARGKPPQRGVFWGRCAGIRACRGKYIQYKKIHTRYIQYTHICIQCLPRPIHTIHTAYMRIHTIHTIHAHMD